MPTTLHSFLCAFAISLIMPFCAIANAEALSTEPTSDVLVNSNNVIAPESISVTSISDVLHRVAQANRSHSYEGLLTYEANGSLSTLRLDHDIVQNTVQQKLEFLDGAKRQFMRNQNLGACTTGETRWGLWPTAFNVDSLSALYHFGIVGNERVADRLTVSIDLVPKDQFRYGYRFSIDEETGLLLRLSTIDKDRVIERTQFVSINVKPIIDEKVIDEKVINDVAGAVGKIEAAIAEEPNGDTDSKNKLVANSMLWRVPEVDPCHTEQFNSAWLVQWVPPGFVPAGNRITTQGEQALMFTDGLVSVSVFIITNNYQDVPKLTARRGATVAVMAPLIVNSTVDKSRSVVVVGEIPPIAARSIALSVKENKPQ